MPRPSGVASLALCLLLASFFSASAQDVKGCGGFIRSEKNIDFSRIQIELYSLSQGAWRKITSTDCAPNNGYYFIPIEGDGTYKLKVRPPQGWKIEPSEEVLQIDGESDPCTTNKDFNFNFIGFGITGSVVSQGAVTGPKGISIELVSSPGNVLQSILTDEEGNYVFFGVLPGQYVVRLGSREKKKYSFDILDHKVSVGVDVVTCEPFSILGYSLSGKVSAFDGNPLKDIAVELLNEDGKGVLKTTKSSYDGSFEFSGVEVGSYTVRVPENGLGITVARPEVTVDVGHENQNVPVFIVKSFSLKGRVAVKDGGPLKDAKVTISPESGSNPVIAITDHQGYFILKGLKSGPMKINVALDGYDFETTTLDTIVPPEIGSVVTISPVRFKVSGRVERDSISKSSEIRVVFMDSKDQTNHVEKVLVTEKGTFSTYLPSGHYFASVELLPSQRIGFAPLRQNLHLQDSPIANIFFQPVKVSVRGNVEVFPNSGEVELALTSGAGADTKRLTVGPDGRFHFSSLLPGTYTVSIVTKDDRCWEKVSVGVEVSSDVDNIIFRQQGFYVKVATSHRTLLVITDPQTKKVVQEVSIAVGENNVCLKSKAEVFQLSTKGCEEFDISPREIGTKSLPIPRVVLKPLRYQISGDIRTKGGEIPDLKLTARFDRRKEEVVGTTIEKNGQGEILYRFTFWSYPGEEITVLPKSEEFLFEPEVMHIIVENKCHVDGVRFRGNQGYFIKGRVRPAVDQAEVRVVGTTLACRTDLKGFYKLGPFPDEGENDYKVEITKEGYIFEEVPTEPGNFVSKKLASIKVKVAGTRSPLSGVVVSVSGGNAYRSNTHTKDDGSAYFLSLSPGEYFVKPQMKEYEFNPKHELLNINEGESTDVDFIAKRVAFSIYGNVKTLNGQPEAGVFLRAKGLLSGSKKELQSVCSGHSEDAVSESKGEFRFRGMVPGCQYSIGLPDGIKTDVERLIPSESKMIVLMPEKDVNMTKDIIAVRSFNVMDMTLFVYEEEGKEVKSDVLVKISVTPQDGNGGYSYSVKRPVGEIMVLPPVQKDGRKYVINAETVSSEKFAPKRRGSLTFKADESLKVFKLFLKKVGGDKVNTQRQSQKKSSSKASLVLLPLFVMAVILFLARDRLPPSAVRSWGEALGLITRSETSAWSRGTLATNETDEVGSSPTRKRNRKRLT